MRTSIALSISILILASTVVSAAGGGGENQVTDIQNSDISEVTFSEVFYGNQDFDISVRLDDDSNISSIQSKIDRQVYGAGEFSISMGGNAADLIRNIPSISINGQRYRRWIVLYRRW